jgi:ribosomal protein S6--L-glutamate ligase
MIYIRPKPTDTPDDNSTGMVLRELDRMGVSYALLDPVAIDPINTTMRGELIWVCGMRQDPVEFETLKCLSLNNRVINSPEAIATCASKAQTSASLIRAGVLTPETIFTSSRTEAEAFLSRHTTAVYKPLYGYDGNGIFPFTSVDALGPSPWYLQEYVKNDRDFRVFVLDGKAVGAIERCSDTFAHNIHQGGEGRALQTIPEAMATIVEQAADAIGISYCGVDLLPTSDGGYTVLEVNGTPNWHCMSAPIWQYLAEYLVEQEKELRK